MLFNKKISALDAQAEALKIAFGPVVFHCVRIAWKNGLLASLEDSDGLTEEELAVRHGLTPYAVSVLLESCLSAGVVTRADSRYTLSKVGHFILHDDMARVNMDFVHDVCYQGLYDLESSLREERPLGLKRLGQWPTLYEGMSQLPEPARSSWFAFDHHYSDSAFEEILPVVFADRPKRLMDIGANTGKWVRHCLEYSADVEVTLVDLPQQLAVARGNLDAARLGGRACYAPVDILDETQDFPGGQQVIWMSQLLSCFSQDKIRSILRRARQSLAPEGRIYILDTFWDRQKYEISAYCLINTSPYFTAIASGNSKMYTSGDYIRCARAEGLALTDARDGFGICHTLLTFETS